MREYVAKNGITKIIARCGVIASVYIVLSFFLTFNVGIVNIRIGECLALLPLILPESVISLFIGCLVSNILLGCVLYDVIFGSVVTLLCGVLTYVVGKRIKSTPLKIFTGGLFPVILNAFLVPLTWYFAGTEQEEIYIIQVLSVFIGQVISVYGVGGFTTVKCEKYKLFK